MPGADYQLTKLLGLRSSVKRVMLYNQGCFAGASALRVAKDLAENNRGARVLVVCSEINAIIFQGPSETQLGSLVKQALFGDGAAAVIVGADPVDEIEKPIFHLLWTAQTILPDREGAIVGNLREAGLVSHLLKDVPGLVSTNIEKALVEAFQQFNISNWNELFWIAHPGGRAILDQVEWTLELDGKKLGASRRVLREYGNIRSGSVLFIMDEMRKSSEERRRKSSEEEEEEGGWTWAFCLASGQVLPSRRLFFGVLLSRNDSTKLDLINIKARYTHFYAP